MENKFFAEKMQSQMTPVIIITLLVSLLEPFMAAFLIMYVFMYFSCKNNPQVIIKDEYISMKRGPVGSSYLFIYTDIESIRFTDKKQCFITYNGKEIRFALGLLSDESYETVKTALESMVEVNG